MSNLAPTQETLQLMAAAQKVPVQDDVSRAFTQPGTATTGLIAYDLETPSKKLYPILTPLRNRIPRRADGYSIQSNWRAVTGINTGNTFPGVAEGRRGGIITQTTADYYAKFVGLGLENSVSFEADFASKNFEDVKALAVIQLLQSLMVQEEFLDLGGNGVNGLPDTACPTPSGADVTSGGTLTEGSTYYFGCVPLTLLGYQQLAAANNGAVGGSPSFVTGLSQVISRTGADGVSANINGGTGVKSALGTANTAAGNAGKHSMTLIVVPVAGAVGYAWYFGTQADGFDVRLNQVTTTNSATITATSGNTAQLITALAATNNSVNSTVYDGMLAQIMKSGSGAYTADLSPLLGGARLTTDGAGGITELNTAFASFWDNYRLSPQEIYVGSQVLMDMNGIIVKNGGAPLIRYNMDMPGGGTLDAGIVVGTVLNKITNQKVKINIHPNMPPGMLMFWSDSVPYPLNDIGAIVLKHLRRDYYQIEWPLVTRSYQYGVYFDGVLKNYFPPAFGLIRGILPGFA